jgi:hypothetical protein
MAVRFAFIRTTFKIAAIALLAAAATGVTAKEPPAAAPASKPAKTAKAAAPSKAVDRNEVLSLYMEGDFETLVALLENIRRERQLRDREDSVFIYKFLGVIYGADERTKRKAESFLYQMLELDPNEDLSALGVGESVQKIFERVRTKVQADSLAHLPSKTAPVAAAPVQPSPAAASAPAASSPAPMASQPAPAARERRVPNWVWYASGGAAAAVVLGIIVLNQDPTPHVNAISDTLR